MLFTIPIVFCTGKAPSRAGCYSYGFFGHYDHSQKVVDICVFHLMISVIVDTADDDDVNGWICFIDHGLIDLQLWSYFLHNDDDIVYWWLSTTIVRVWDEKNYICVNKWKWPRGRFIWSFSVAILTYAMLTLALHMLTLVC